MKSEGLDVQIMRAGEDIWPILRHDAVRGRVIYWNMLLYWNFTEQCKHTLTAGYQTFGHLVLQLIFGVRPMWSPTAQWVISILQGKTHPRLRFGYSEQHYVPSTEHLGFISFYLALWNKCNGYHFSGEFVIC